MSVRILFLSQHGVLRCQIAAKIARQFAASDIEIIAAGVDPREPDPAAVSTLAATGIELPNQMPPTIKDLDTASIDLVITLDKVASGHCPVLPNAPAVIRWDIPTPQHNGDSSKDSLESIRNLLERKIRELFSGGYLHTIMNLKRNHEAVLDHFSEGIIVHDPDRTITWFNQAAEEMTGFSRHEVIGRDCHDIFPGGFCSGKCSFCNGTNQIFDKIDYPVNITTKDGHIKRAEMTVIAMHDENQTFQGVLACFRDVTEVTQLRHKLKSAQSFHGIIGRDDEMLSIYENIKDLAASDCSVLIQGESGTGKELVAGAIHGESAREGRPFVTVNCGALPEGILESELFGHVRGAFTGAVRDKKGRFELADTGTIFLDEIGELSPNMQVKLLRVLQESTIERVGDEKSIKVNVRVLSATNRDLRQMIRKRQFREDLFYRICVVPIYLPPLRKRRNDIPLLTDQFVRRFSADTGKNIKDVSAETLNQLMDYAWPGNVRELQNAIQYAFVKCKNDIIQLNHLPPEIISAMENANANSRKRQGKLDYDQVIRTLQKYGGNKKKAAESLGVGRSTIHRFIKNHDLKV